MTPTLLLFDIDGTLLLRAAAEHRDALYEALRAVLGIDPEHVRVDHAGRTDVAIMRSVALACDVPAERFDAAATDLRLAATEAYARRVPDDLRAHVAPGMAALLDRLGARNDVALSLVTGNCEAIAHLKLRAAGIGHHFPADQGGFGSDSEDRTDLPPLARRRAGTPGAPHPRAHTLVIGDTVRDIACAHADGLRCIAIATGPHPAADLQAADAVVTSAAELESALEQRISDHF